jgi:hypothetical protein
MTGFNHATTGALIAGVVVNPLVAIPLAFVSHFVLDAIPHFGWDFDQDVFERNRSKELRLALVSEIPLSILAIVTLPIIMKPIVSWRVTLLSIFAAMCMDFIWIYRGIREELTKKVKPRNWIMNFHLKASNHHQKFIIGMLLEVLWFAVAFLLILQLVRNV